LIYEFVDYAFQIFMWMLLDPTGREVFYALDTIGVIGGIAYLVWDIRSDDELEKSGRPSDTGSQRKSAEGEDKGSSR